METVTMTHDELEKLLAKEFKSGYEMGLDDGREELQEEIFNEESTYFKAV